MSKTRLKRQDLLRTRVLGQIDRKFIVCTLDIENGERILVAIDQHAASERVRVERFLKDLCEGFLGEDGDGPDRLEINPPKPALLTKPELTTLHSPNVAEELRRWGFGFSKESTESGDEGEDGQTQVHVNYVPKVIGAKVW